MHSQALIFIQDLALIMLVAGFTTILCHRFKQPVVLGYIIAGIILSSHTPPFSFITDETTIKTLAEIGVIFLMFALGLEFNLHKLAKVGKTAVITAALEILLMVWVGYEIGVMLGWSYINSIFLGAILSISSTTIIVKALSELGLKKEEFAQVIFGILIIEDIFAILILALLSSMVTTGKLQVTEVLINTAKLSSFLIITLLIGILLVPRLLSYVAKFKSKEVLLITVLGLCFGFCLLVSKLNYSIALGAFIIGAVIAESYQLNKVEHLVRPLRYMFSAIFFVSVGLLFDPKVIVERYMAILIITLAVVVGKIISCSFGMLITGHNGKVSMRVGMGLAQIGEFSFIIAALGITLNVTGEFLYSIAVCVSILTTLLTPYLIKYSDSFTGHAAKFMPKKVVKVFQMYVDYMQDVTISQEKYNLKKIIQRSFLQIIINLLIVMAIFMVGSYIAQTSLGDSVAKAMNTYVQKTLMWSTSLILSLPFLIATYRKIRALSMLFAEVSIRSTSRFAGKVRKLISVILPAVLIAFIMIFISFMSINILPPMELLFLVLVIVALIIFFSFPWMVRVHSRLQIKLIKSLKKDKGKP